MAVYTRRVGEKDGPHTSRDRKLPLNVELLRTRLSTLQASDLLLATKLGVSTGQVGLASKSPGK